MRKETILKAPSSRRMLWVLCLGVGTSVCGMLLEGVAWWMMGLSAAAVGAALPFRAARAEPAVSLPPENGGWTTVQALHWLHEEAPQLVPVSVQEVLAGVVVRAKDLLPQLQELEQAGAIPATDRVALRQTIKVYLPRAIRNYASLPQGDARTRKVAGGAPAEALLLEQLRLADGHLQRLQEQVFSAMADSLLAETHSLNERLGTPLLESPSHHTKLL